MRGGDRILGPVPLVSGCATSLPVLIALSQEEEEEEDDEEEEEARPRLVSGDPVLASLKH